MAVTQRKTSYSRPKLVSVAQTTEGYTTSFDGTKIWYRSVGSGIPIVCCNGLGCSTFYFSYLEDYFKRYYRVITWDYRGHGKSEPPKIRKNHTIESLTHDLNAVMASLNVDKAIMVGHSMGTQVLYEFYARNPQKCLSLIPCFGTFEKPIDTFLDSSVSKYVFEFIYIFNHLFPKLSQFIGVLMIRNPLWFQIGGLLKMLKPYLADKRIMKQYMEHIVHVDPIFLSKLTKSMQNHTAESSLKKIKVPTLIFGAEEDMFTPVWLSKKMHHLIPDSELFIVKKGSHVALVEQPELINLRMEKFLQERVLHHKIMSKKSEKTILPSLIKKTARTNRVLRIQKIST